MKYILTIFILNVFSISAFGQFNYSLYRQNIDERPTIGLVGGISGFNSMELEAGLGFNLIESRPSNKMFVKPFIGCSLSGIINPNNQDLKGGSLNVWMNGLIVLGLNQNYYQKGGLQTWGMKPFIGLELFGVTCIYGYNFFLNGNKIEEISNNVFSIRYFLPIARFKRKDK